MASASASASAASSTRCARADCLSVRDEQELLKGDLDELERENEQLHDRVAHLEREASAATTRHDRELETAREQLATRDHELAELREQLQAAKATAATAAGAADVATASAPSNAPRNTALEQEYASLRDKAMALERALAEAEARVAQAKEAVPQQQPRQQQQRRGEAASERDALYQVLRENEQLRHDKDEMEAALQRVSEVALDYEVTIKVLHSQSRDYLATMDTQTVEITQLHTRMEQVEQEKQALADKLMELDEQESDVDQLVQELRGKSEMEKTVLRAEMEQLRQRLAELQRQLSEATRTTGQRGAHGDMNGEAATSLHELEAQLEMLQELRIRDRATIRELERQVQQQQIDLETMAEHVTLHDDELAQQQQQQEGRGRAETSGEQSVGARQDTSEALTRRLKEQSGLVRELEAQQSQLEHELANARAWNTKYEAGAGLEEVVKFQKKLRRELDKQQKSNQQLRLQLNAQIDAASKLQLAFERLKREAGKPEEFVYDDLVLEQALQGQLAVNQAVMTQMEHQIQELESERVRLLQQLREQARRVGGKLYEAHGLTIEQWRHVEEFMQCLKVTPEIATRWLSGSRAEAIHSFVSPATMTKATMTVVTVHDEGGAREEGDLNAEADSEAVAMISAARDREVAEVGRLKEQVTRLQNELETARQRAMRGEEEQQRLHHQLREFQDGQHMPSIVKADSESTKPRSSVPKKVAGSPVRSAATRTVTSSVVKEEEEQQEVTDRFEELDDLSIDSSESEASEALARIVEERSSTQLAVRGRSKRAARSRDPRASTPSTSAPILSADALADAITLALETRLAALYPRAMTSPATGDAVGPIIDSSSAATASSLRTAKHGITSPTTSATALDDKLAFASEQELNQQIDFLKEFQLLLDEFVHVDAENEALRDQLMEHETAFKAVMDQQSVVYQHLFHLHDTAARERHRFQFEAQQSHQQQQQLAMKCQRYEATLHTLQHQREEGDGVMVTSEPSTVVLRGEVIDLTRKVAQFEVVTAQRKRELELLREEHRLCLSNSRRLENDWLEMERTLKCRILYLESWKSGAEAMVARMDKTLDDCVLKSVARRQQREMEVLLAKHTTLNAAYATLHANYLTVFDLPTQLTKLQHENALLVAERAARLGAHGDGVNAVGATHTVDKVVQSRVAQLEAELQTQLDRVKALEESLQASVRSTGAEAGEGVGLAVNTTDSRGAEALEKENTLLYERIQELEQLYASLSRELATSKDVAILAASQAHELSRRITQERARRDASGEDCQRVKELMTASEDHALVARLQQQLLHMKSNYQQFLLKYDHAVEAQQQTQLRCQQLELAMEDSAQRAVERQEAAHLELVVWESAVHSFKERDYMMRNSKWDAFKKRLDGLESEMRVEQDRRRAVEKELEEKQAELPFATSRSGSGSGTVDSAVAAVEMTRLRRRVDALETRERELMSQLEAQATTTSARSHTSREQEQERSARSAQLEREVGAIKALNAELLQRMEVLQARVAELHSSKEEVDAQRRAVVSAKEDLEIEFQQLKAQLRLYEGGNGKLSSRSNQEDEGASPTSPLMRQKVGLYEKDQAQLQQAAQATIASLKLLVDEKNALITEYQRKLTAVRSDVAVSKAEDRVETTQLNKKLYEDNQSMIAQLKDAMATIHHLEKTGTNKKALRAAEERHEFVLQEWKRVEMEAESARMRIRELEVERTVVQNERDLAEARAGEALEEMVLKQEAISTLEREKKQLDGQLAFVKREMQQREGKMQLLRDAIIKLKEEFLKAEDRHAVSLAKAEHVAAAHSSRSVKSDHERAAAAWAEEKEQLKAQVQILQEKLALARKAEDKLKKDLARYVKKEKRKDRDTDKNSGRSGGDGASDNAEGCTTASTAMLQEEIERLKNVLKERVVSEARITDELEKKIRVLQAQNLALRDAAPSTRSLQSRRVPESQPGYEEGGSPDTTTLGARSEKKREQWESEKRLQRRVEVMAMRLREKQAEAEAHAKENDHLKEQVRQAHAKLSELERKTAATKSEANENQEARAQETETASAAETARVNDLKRQNTFLQETLVLKRKEWEVSFQTQMGKYEHQVQRLRARLGMERSSDDALDDLAREERTYLVSQEIRDEVAALGDELREKEQLLVEKETKLMETELELEGLRVEYQRLHRKSAQMVANSEPSAGTRTRRSSAGGGATGAVAATRKSSMQERLELEEVIENMKKVIDKLRTENDRWKRQPALTPEQADALRKRLREARAKQQQLGEELERVERENGELKKEKLRLQQRLRAATSSARAPTAVSSTSEDGDRRREHQRAAELAQRVESLMEELDQLQATIAQKDAMIQELHHELRNAGSGEELNAREAELEALARENAELREELGAFDEDFFEEIEDLKYKYAQAIRDKQQLERRLQ